MLEKNREKKMKSTSSIIRNKSINYRYISYMHALTLDFLHRKNITFLLQKCFII